MKLIQMDDDLIVNPDHVIFLQPMLAGKATVIRLAYKYDATVNKPMAEVAAMLRDDWIDPPVKEKSHGKR